MYLIPRSRFNLGDDFFEDFFEPTIKNQMKCDVYEKDGNYHIEMDVPGYKKEDIKIECENGYLTISAESKKEENEEEKNYIRRERYYGTFSRSFHVGDVRTDTIHAEFDNGILKITVPKEQEETSKTQIEIN